MSRYAAAPVTAERPRPTVALVAHEIHDGGGMERAMAELWATVDDPDAFIQADLAFHRAVFVASDNDLLLYIHDVISGPMSAVRPMHTHSIGHNRATLPNHERVTVAIRRRHHRKAEEAMREIVEVARQDALRGREERR